ncbi:MAG TPA: 5'/3'-nucleotidase SurE [Candidatus Acidoferrales bacterium]
MRQILVTNDDGVQSPGLKALVQALSELGQVTVVAPTKEVSAQSHGLSLRRPIRFERVAERTYAVEGTPADSVILALNKIMKARPDLLVSGINRGGNMGENIYYSGTVAAAVEGTLNGIPSFAISVAHKDGEFDFEPAAAFAVKLAKRILAEELPKGVTLNVNVPQPWNNGVEITRQSNKIIKNLLVENTDPRGRRYYWLHEEVDRDRVAPGTDYAAVFAGSISITPLDLDRTNRAALNHLSHWVEELSPRSKRSSARQDLPAQSK